MWHFPSLAIHTEILTEDMIWNMGCASNHKEGDMGEGADNIRSVMTDPC